MDLISKLVIEIVNPVIIIIISLAVAVFLWGIIEMILGAAKEEKRTAGKRHIVWGLVGLLIMFTVKGIIEIINNFVQFRP